MTTYRKKPIEVEAMRYDGPDGRFGVDDLRNVFGASVEPTAHWGDACGEPRCGDNYDIRVYNASHDDWNLAHPGDWIIRGTSGEYYPCDPGTFAAVYEAVEES